MALFRSKPADAETLLHQVDVPRGFVATRLINSSAPHVSADFYSSPKLALLRLCSANAQLAALSTDLGKAPVLCLFDTSIKLRVSWLIPVQAHELLRCAQD